MDRLISMEPSNFVIVRIEPGQKCSGELTLRNVMYTMPVAFRLQPVNKSRYLIKPQSGIISPLATLTVEIIYHLQPVDSINNNNNHISILPDCFPHSNDSFLLQSVVVPGARIKDHASTLDSVPNDWFTNRKKQVFSDSGIKVMFVGSPILVHLVMDGSMDEIREVLERSDPVTKPADSVDLHGETLLHIAIAQSRPDIVQLLLEFHPDIELQSGRSKWSPLEAAAASGDALIVELLLAKNAKTERSESSTHGAIHLAVIGGHTEVLKLLLVKGADVNAGTKDGNTALHLAVEERRKDFARFLLSNGAKPDIRNDSDGSTPLHIAAGVGDERLVKLLIRKGANKYIRNKAGKTPYDVAADYGHIRLFHELKLGDSLCIAARKGDVRTIQKLIHNGAILNGRDQHGWSALHRTSFKGKIEAVRFLIDKGIDINGTDDDGYTALHCGVENGQSEVTELLVKRGADVEAKTRKGVTPLEIAESLGYVGISRILVHGGAVRDNGSKNAEKTGRESMESGGMEMMTKMKKKPAERRMTRGSFARTLPQAVL